MMKGIAISFLVVLAMVQFMAKPGDAVNCQQVNSALGPCLTYLEGGPGPSQPCCAGVTSLKDMAVTKQDRQQACECVKAVASTLPGLKPDRASGLPADCKVQISIPISPTTNCATINLDAIE